MSSDEEESNILFTFDDINNINDINEHTVLHDIEESVDDLKTIHLDMEDEKKLRDPILFVNPIIGKDEQFIELDVYDDPLNDDKYTNHHKNLKKIEYNDYLLQKYENKDLFEELSEDLQILSIDMNIDPKSKNYKKDIINSVLKDIKTTVHKLCHVHDIDDFYEVIQKKELCVNEITKLLKYNKFMDFRRSLMIKKINKKYSNEFIRKHKDINIYEPWDQKFIHRDHEDLIANVEYDCESDEEEDMILLNMGNAEQIKMKRLTKLYNELGIQYGRLILGSKELIIEPFKTPYFKPSKS
ncbi:uncharacterized protein HGUI_03558 [Hanseniaspora guilliermondii]|uniref:Something about silencing protein 4 domain-containing protein n=1 Tax=Hanseniaspora guilliermondii TaxID=56406 RepID=A0A1L0CQS8_9ASCO|nr:uncharacterized protein HGUI_03558 [Hanseniaspora guilliermondii]